MRARAVELRCSVAELNRFQQNSNDNKMKSRAVFPTLDFTAVGLSGLCLLHCLALPILSLALPIAGTVAEQEWIHKALVLMAIPISGYAVFKRGAHFRDGIFVVLVTLGLALLAAAAFVDALHDLEKPMTGAGAVIVAAGHLWRWRRHHKPRQKSGEAYADKT